MIYSSHVLTKTAIVGYKRGIMLIAVTNNVNHIISSHWCWVYERKILSQFFSVIQSRKCLKFSTLTLFVAVNVVRPGSSKPILALYKTVTARSHVFQLSVPNFPGAVVCYGWGNCVHSCVFFVFRIVVGIVVSFVVSFVVCFEVSVVIIVINIFLSLVAVITEMKIVYLFRNLPRASLVNIITWL